MNTGFKGCHPTVNILFFISVAIFGLLLQHPVSLAISLISSLAYYIRLKGKTAARSFGLFFLPMIVFVTLINGLFSHYGLTVLFSLPSGKNVTFESMIYGFVVAVTAVAVIEWFQCYSEVVTTDKFMHVFGRFLPKTVLIISMILRFIPMYRERLRIITQAQCGIGMDYKSGSISSRIRNGSKIISILITWALENAIETSESMCSRGYGVSGRSNYSRFKWKPSDIVVLIIMLVLILYISCMTVLGEISCEYNPQIIINPVSDLKAAFFIERFNIIVNPMSWYGISLLTAYGILAFLPLIIDLKEDIKWNSIKSKI